jgi:hypothetical protein
MDIENYFCRYKILFNIILAASQKGLYSNVVSLWCHALRDYVNFTNFAFWIKCQFNIGI